MCGIAGQLFLDGQELVSDALIKRMTDAIAHRGPDGEGHYVHGAVGLGHRRLSIIDLHTGAQPMCNEDGTVWIVFNGEIYNYRALRAELIGRGHTFKSTTDTEVIVHLYEEMAEDCVTRLQGMFSFAIWDERNRRLFLARDRVGIKPLYFTTNGNSFLFASEIKALFTDTSVAREFSPQSVDRFLTYYYLPGADTLFQGIRKLEPGHYLVVEKGTIRKHQYWDLRMEVSPRWNSFGDAVEELQALLHSAVESHLISDVPVGVLLSGGVDSTGVLRYATECSSQPLHTFTVGFDDESIEDERTYARLVAQRYGTTHQDISISCDAFANFLPEYVWHMEEPVCEPPAIALYYIAKKARESSVKVLLSGEGGDEVFGGYNKYAYLMALESMKSHLGPFKGLLRLGLLGSGFLGSRSLPQYAELVEPTLESYYLSCTSSPFAGFNRRKKTLYTPQMRKRLFPCDSQQPTRELFAGLNGNPILNKMLHVDSKTWLPDDLLVKADKMTMAASVELRVPLLDTALIEFAASLPTHFKLRGWPPKRILRAALQGRVPAEVLKRKKVGFPVPYDRWLRAGMKELVYDTVLGSNGVLQDYFSREALSTLLHSHARGEGGSQEIFSLLILDSLHSQFVAASA